MKSQIKGTTEVIGLIGNPLKHSLSPQMHNTTFDKLNLDYVYLCFETKDNELSKAIEMLKFIKSPGANITFPHKQNILNYLDEISEEAKIIGSVNTVTIDPITQKIKGYNTDGKGFVSSLDDLNIKFRNEKITIVGVGGAGRAIAIQLAYEGAKEIVIKENSNILATEVKNTINKYIPKVIVKLIGDFELKKELEDSVLFINATPLGMKGREDLCIIENEDVLHENLFVYDIVYDPRESKLLKYAKKKGCKTSNGINMMLWQGAMAFELWFNKKMPINEIKKELFE